MDVSGAKILVVDDTPEIRDGLASYLSALGASVLTASHGRAALRVLDREPGIQLVITDIIMPDMEGMGLILNVKRKYPEMSIIAMSGGGKIDKYEYLSSALALGAGSVLAKPFDPDEVVKAIDRLPAAAP